ncbi:ThuA domain-containing protein [Stieleria varia]|uniref:Trehalose utilization n=1 Tax=Stieleria varia TaxID=2528005 RepID=A0A5C6AJ86_9BACT|nr:ThuA domain-containing protein [Stieleria varia]TWT98303.1 Trehalose utilization [Stieleria varia]
MHSYFRTVATMVAVLSLTLSCVTENAGAADDPHVVIMVAEREYQTDESLTAFAKQHLASGYRVSILRAADDDRNRFVGAEAIDSADVLIISVRRRTLPAEQLDKVRRHVAEGKPVIGIRTANHAFCLRNEDPPADRAAWPEFDKEVFAGSYTNHYGKDLKTTLQVVPTAASHPILAGIDSNKTYDAGGSLYKVAPLGENTTTLMSGTVTEKPTEPIAWTHTRSDGGKSFYTSLGHVDDFAGPVLPRMLKNAIQWGLMK